MMFFRIAKAAPPGAAFLLLLALLAGCVSNPERRQEVATVAAQQGFADVSTGSGPARIYALLRGKAGPDQVLDVYIEGDGAAWPSTYRPPADPTPDQPIVVSMAFVDPAPAVAYIGRPCQYLDEKSLAACPVEAWTTQRFAPQLLESISATVDGVKAASGARRIRLIGYSGGGVMAALLAARRDDVKSYATIAAPLSVEVWTALHQITPLAGLDPMKSANRRLPPAVHFIGGRDTIVPETVVAGFATQTGGRLAIIDGFDHDCCWANAWPVLLRDVP